jgi:hypothetical protein
MSELKEHPEDPERLPRYVKYSVFRRGALQKDKFILSYQCLADLLNSASVIENLVLTGYET